MDKKHLQTQFSVKASTLAESFQNTVGRMPVGPQGYKPDLTSPDGPSTGGGVQAMQHLRLLPPTPSMPTIVVGHANQRDGTAEVRSYAHVDAIYRERFHEAAPFDQGEYDAFLQSAQGFLAACGLRVSIAVQSQPPPPPEPTAAPTLPPAAKRRMVTWVVVAAMIAAAVGGAIVWVLKG